MRRTWQLAEMEGEGGMWAEWEGQRSDIAGNSCQEIGSQI